MYWEVVEVVKEVEVEAKEYGAGDLVYEEVGYVEPLGVHSHGCPHMLDPSSCQLAYWEVVEEVREVEVEAKEYGAAGDLVYEEVGYAELLVLHSHGCPHMLDLSSYQLEYWEEEEEVMVDAVVGKECEAAGD